VACAVNLETVSQVTVENIVNEKEVSFYAIFKLKSGFVDT
jgi:hypothetical protein